MTKYSHLSQEERYLISTEMKRHTSIRQIALLLGRSPSTLSREIQRNSGERGYRNKQAQTKANLRRRKNTSQLTDFAYAFIEYLLECKWSPEQIAGALTARGWIQVPSHEWIYQYIYRNKKEGGDLYTHLHAQKTYRKRGFMVNDRRGSIRNKVSIHARPLEIEQRQDIGDFEGDTVIGANHKGAILTLVDRKSLFTIMEPLQNKNSANTMKACLKGIKSRSVNSITFDNGKEFAEHQMLRKANIEVYFADAYCSNQRARNENTNGLIRQYLPKGSSFVNLTERETTEIQDALNNRPRKTLGWFTPAQVFAGFLGVALHV